MRDVDLYAHRQPHRKITQKKGEVSGAQQRYRVKATISGSSRDLGANATNSHGMEREKGESDKESEAPTGPCRPPQTPQAALGTWNNLYLWVFCCCTLLLLQLMGKLTLHVALLMFLLDGTATEQREGQRGGTDHKLTCNYTLVTETGGPMSGHRVACLHVSPQLTEQQTRW